MIAFSIDAAEAGAAHAGRGHFLVDHAVARLVDILVIVAVEVGADAVFHHQLADGLRVRAIGRSPAVRKSLGAIGVLAAPLKIGRPLGSRRAHSPVDPYFQLP